jgi:RHS repeat-associated protein
VTVAGQELLNLRYTYDEVSNIKTITDGGKIKTFEYDKNNQLTKAIIPGTFIEPTPTPGTAALKVGDTLGNGVFEFTPILSGLMGLDYYSSSIGIDFGMVAPGVKKIELVPDEKYSTHRITDNTIALYISNDNTNYTLIPRTDWEYQKDEKGIITLTLKERLATRYLKLHIKYDERGWNYEPVNKSTFLNEIAKMLRVYQEATSRTEEYQYDAAGNRKLSRVTLVQTAELTSQYYTNTDRLKTDGRYAFTYDNAGNMVKKGNTFVINEDTVNFTTSGEGVEYWEYKYDLLNRLINVTKNGTIVAEYAYDPEGLRVVKKAKGETTHYVFQGTEPIFEKRINAGKTKSYVYALGKYLARVDGVIGDPDAKKYFYHTDYAGSIRVITDQAGEVVYKADYFAFGTQFAKDGEFEELHGFTGKEYDPDIGLYYFNARWYDPDLGRFISEDPAGQGPNPYSYCGNNPLNRVDPTGKVWWWLVSAIISGLDSYLCGGDFLQGFVMGAFTGAMGYGINAFVGQAWGATLGAVGTRVVSGAIAGGIMGGISGQGAIKGAVYGAVSGVISYEMDMRYGEFADKNWFNEALIGGLKGGFNALLRGGDFVEGFEYGTVSASTSIIQKYYSSGGGSSGKVVIVVGEDSDNGNFVKAGETYKLETTSYGDEVITIICGKDVKSVDELMQKIEDIASKGKIDRIAYFGHSGRSALYAFEAPGENIYAREGWQKSWFNEGAKMELYGCNAGVGFRSIAQKLADKTGISVWAYTSSSFFTADYKLGHLQRLPTDQDVAASRVDGDRIWLTPNNGRPMTEFTPHPWYWYWNPKNW